MDDKIRFESESLPGDALRVLAFSCEEQLGAPYSLRVHIDLKAELPDLEDALGKPGTLTFGSTVFHGLLLEAELLLAVGDRRIFRLLLGPALRALDFAHHSRVFIDKTVPDVIEAILKENELSTYELRLSGKYAKRKHICQYKESDLAFLHRWMEREGIYYYFLQEDAAEKLIICDDKSRHDDADPAAVRYHPTSGDDALAGESFGSWRRVHAGVTESVTLGDYDYLKPALKISGKKAQSAVGFEEFVRFEDNLWDQPEADRLAGVRAEHLKAAQVRFHGRGRARGLHAGLCFTLEEHPREPFNQRYQICRVTHYGTLLRNDPALERQLDLPRAEGSYQVLVEVLPDSVQYRPERRTPWPAVHGVESALVDGQASSPYAQIDSEGRYRVRMLFDEAQNPDGSASAWLRMLQPHGGAPEGHHFPLRKGTEVLVAFVHGDPDRPYIVGAAPAQTTPSQVTSKNHTKNVLQTGSLNRVEIEDLEGDQYIDISTPPEKTFVHLGAHAGLGDHNIVTKTSGDGLHNAGGNRDITVGGDQTEDVTGNVTEEYAANQTTHVFGSFTETINSGETQTISAGSTQTIDGGLTQTIDGGDTRTVNGSLTETINGDRTQTITGSTTETIGGSLSQTVVGSINISTPASYVLNAAGGVNMITPATGKVTGLGGVTLIAPGGQMTVDSFWEGIGKQHAAAYFLKISIGVFRLAITVAWTRTQHSHICGYGLKIDTKVLDSKKWATESYYGALEMRAFAQKSKKNGAKQIS
ncbi:MAG: type VI secretion system tip protein VgrG [Polyangiaceae bacterium]|nr:type VI secretion system tip protein VgrG [Polyangiaceae bacterium]